ncbi:patatin-like phospholipase family protein [Pantoea allii]|uniref:patatin-like phospholipase family protein n=1 Tax=Pantoea allii TaxID=574096 RepID=UPI003D7BF73C
MNKNSSNLECFAVFEGGGAKGIAFAGALEAVEEQGLKFTGYGGASSGAIIALLSCLGYTGKEIKQKLKEDKILKLLDKRFLILLSWIKLMAFFNSKIKFFLNRKLECHKSISYKYSISFVRFFTFLFLYFNLISLAVYLIMLITVVLRKGLFRKNKLINTLKKYAYEKIYMDVKARKQKNKMIDELTFQQLEKLTGVKLKIIATDIITGTVVELSSEATPDELVFESVAASSSYPIFFRPSFMKNKILTDGGVSCNLPSFLFNPLEFNRLPVYAFDLRVRSINEYKTNKISFLDFAKKLIMSTVDASNNIISDVTGGIVIPVNVSPRFGTFSFNLKDEELEQIFRQAKFSARKFLEKDFFTSSLLSAKTYNMFATLMYGDLNHLLSLILIELETIIPDQKITMSLMTDITATKSKIVCFSQCNNYGSESVYDSFDINNHDELCVTAWLNDSLYRAYKAYDEINNVTVIYYPVERSNRYDANYTGLNKSKIALIELKFATHFSRLSILQSNNGKSDSVKDVDLIDDFSIILDGYCFVIRNAMLGYQAIFHESKNTR